MECIDNNSPKEEINSVDSCNPELDECTASQLEYSNELNMEGLEIDYDAAVKGPVVHLGFDASIARYSYLFINIY